MKIFESFKEHLNENTKTVYFGEDNLYGHAGYREFGEKFAGDLEHKDAPSSWYILLVLDAVDKEMVKNIKLNVGDYIFRYETYNSKVAGMQPFVKVNTKQGLVYFTEDLTSDIVSFSKRGSKIKFLNLRKKYI